MSNAFIIINDNYVKIFRPDSYPYNFDTKSYGHYIDLIIDLYHDLIIDTIYNYDSKKGNTFRTYFYRSLEYRIKDFFNKFNKIKDKENIRINKRFNESENDMLDYIDYNIINDSKHDEYDDVEHQNADLIMFTCCCIMKFLSVNSKQNNEKRKMYFKLFNTDIIVQYMIDLEKINYMLIKHENIILSTIEIDFLNFFMAKDCECIADMIMCPLKKLKDILGETMDSSNSDEICPLPLPAKVYILYLKVAKGMNVSKVLISQQKSNFQNCMKEFRKKNKEKIINKTGGESIWKTNF